MRKLSLRFKKRLGVFAFVALALIAVITVLSGGTLAVGLVGLAVVAPLALTDKEQAIVDNMKTTLQAEAEKLGKGYIKTDEFTATFNTMFGAAMAKFNFEADKVKQVTDAVSATLAKYDLSANESFLKVQQNIETLNQNKPTAQVMTQSTFKALTAVKDDIKSLLSGVKGEVFIDVNASNTTRSSVSDNTGSERIAGMGQLAVRKLPMKSLCRAIPMNGTDDNGDVRYIDWDEDTTVRAAAMVAEEGHFPVSEAKWKEYKLSLKKIGDTLAVSEEMLEDLQSFAAELDMFLETNVQIVEDSQLLTGIGTGSNMKGMLPSIPEFTYADYADSVQDASEYDLIVKVLEAITSTGGNKYLPDFALMPSALITKMMLKKDDNNNYVLPPFMVKGSDGKMVIANVTVIQQNGFSDNNQMAIGDSAYMRLYYKAGIVLSRGTIGTQFSDDLITLKARMRELFLIRAADQSGFRKVSNVSTAIASIDAIQN